MSETTQNNKADTKTSSTKVKAEKEPCHLQTFVAIEGDLTGPAPEELFDGIAENGSNVIPNGILSHEPSTLLQRQAAPVVRPLPAPAFTGKSFAHIPPRTGTQTSIQTKLTVGAAHDPYEEEADEVAEQVMRLPALSFDIPAGVANPNDKGQPLQRALDEEEELQTKPLAATITPLVQRIPAKDDEDEAQPEAQVQRVADEETDLQTKRVTAADSFEMGGDFEERVVATRGGGAPLPAEVRTFMEPRFGADFSGVRVHADSEAADLNRRVSAQAFTLGHDVYLGEGKTDLSSDSGKQLLAHELTHVVQQGGASQLRRAPEDEDELVQVNVETPAGAQSAEMTAASDGKKTDNVEVQPEPGTVKGASPQDNLGSKSESFKQMAFDEERQGKGNPLAQEMARDTSAGGKFSQNVEGAQLLEGKQSVRDDQWKKPLAGADTADQVQADKSNEAESKASAKSKGMQPAKAGAAEQGKKLDSKSTKLTTEKGKESADQAKAPEPTKPGKPAVAEEKSTQDSVGTESVLADQSLQFDAGIVEEVQAKVETAEAQKEQSDQLVQQTTEQLTALDGAEAIIPEDLWKELNLDQKDIAAPAESFALHTPESDQAAELLIQRSPDPGKQDPPQGVPQQISVPTLTIDTAPITKAAATAKTGAGFAAKILALPTAVAAAQKRVDDAYNAALKKLNDQLPLTLRDLDTAAQTTKDDITTKFNTANQSVTTLEGGIAPRVEAVIKLACDEVDKVVGDYVAKCDPEARQAIKSYCDTQLNTPDDPTIIFPLPPIRAEEEGYHARKAAVALDAAVKVGQAYTDEYRKQGEDTKGALRGQVRNDLASMMQNEINGMRTTLVTAQTDAFTVVDQTKREMVKQATDLHSQSVTTLENAYTSTTQDLTNYQTQLTTELTTAQTSFDQQVDSSASTAISEAQAALASAQSALAAVIKQATGPDRGFRPGAQQAIDQAAANIQGQLQQQIADAAAGITQQGTQMTATVSALDVQTGSGDYATTFETTTTNMLTQVIDNGLIAIHTNMVDYGTQVAQQTEDGFTANVKAVTDALQQIEDGGKQNLPNFVNTQFKPGLDTAHQNLAQQAAAEGEKAGNATLPRWKEVLKVVVSIVIAVVVAVVIIAVVAATGGIAGVILGALVGAAMGALGGAAKCLFNNLMDGKQDIWENVGREAALGAISGLLTGLTAGVLGIAFQGTLTVGQMIMREAIDAGVSALKDGLVEAISQGVKYGKVDVLSVLGTIGESLVINLVTAGIFKGPGIYKAATAAKGAAQEAAQSAATEVDNGIREGVEQAPGGSSWNRPPRTRSEAIARDLGWPEPEAGYRWNMSKSGVPYQQRIDLSDGLPEPPKFTIPAGQQMPLGLGLGPGKPSVTGALDDLPLTPPKSVPTGQLQLPFMGNPANPLQNLKYGLWDNPYWAGFNPKNWNGAAAGAKAQSILPWYNPFSSTNAWKDWQWGKSGVKEGLKYGYSQLGFGNDSWETAKEHSFTWQNRPDGWNPQTPTAGLPPQPVTNPTGNTNIPVPAAPYFNPQDWDFDPNTPIPGVDLPTASDSNFDSSFDQDAVLDEISEQK